MRDTVRSVIGEDTANQLRTCWNVDKQGEIQTCWRNSFVISPTIVKVVLMFLHRGVEGFWLQAGNFFQARCFSRLLALQIQAIELGLNPKDAPYPEYVLHFLFG